MTQRSARLELTWIGKEQRPKLEPRILLEDPTRSYHAAHRVGEGDIFDNRLIFGDNLLALKALEQEFAGKINCVFIGPYAYVPAFCSCDMLRLSGEEKGFAAGWLAAYTTCACGSYIYVGENPNVLTRYYAKRSLMVWNRS